MSEHEEFLNERGLTVLMKWKSPVTARLLRHRGGGPPFRRIGRRIIYIKSEVMSWVMSRPSFRSTTEADEFARRTKVDCGPKPTPHGAEVSRG